MPPRNRGRNPRGQRPSTKQAPESAAPLAADPTPDESTQRIDGGGDRPVGGMDSDAIRKALARDYEVLEELGRGGMAIVYRALERELDREVAIKVLPPAMTMDTEFVDRFQREARTAGQLEHPNIVPIYRVGRASDNHNVIFFVMKFLRGQSLAQVLRDRNKLPVEDVKRILIETAGALGYAAKRGVVHRDIKPDNVMLDGEGRCVVTDFGIAKTSSGPLTAAGTSMGTPRYMSPEHAQGSRLDGRSDLYSLGVVAYQCLAGHTPYDADDPFAILYKHINEPLPRPALQSDEEWALYAVVERMLAKNPNDRFQTADDLIGTLGGQVHSVTLVNAQATSPQSVFGPTEIIPTPAAGLHWAMPRQWRMWGAAGGVLAVFGLAAVLSRPDGPSVTDSIALASMDAGGAPAPAPIVVTDSAAGDSAARAADSSSRGSDTSATVASAGSRVTTPRTAAAPAPSRPAPARDPYSACPRLPASEATKLLVVLVDTILAQRRGDNVRVVFDVCGIPAAGPYTGEVTVQRLDQGRTSRLVRGGTPPLREEFIASSTGPRMRRYHTVNIGGLPSGRYLLTMVLKDKQGREANGQREFRIVDR